jgi:hypothetical protein
MPWKLNAIVYFCVASLYQKLSEKENIDLIFSPNPMFPLIFQKWDIENREMSSFSNPFIIL